MIERLDAIAPEDVAHIAHPWYYKSYLLFTWLNSLVRNTQLLDAVECLVGENIICISCDIWRKRAGETRSPWCGENRKEFYLHSEHLGKMQEIYMNK